MESQKLHLKLHEEALRLSKNYFKAEAELLNILQKIDSLKTFRNYGCTSLFQYAVTVLNLSESTAFNFINVARKAVQIPELKEEIDSGNLSVSKARKIVPVLNKDDTKEAQLEWIHKAKTLTSKKLEQEVAHAAPKEETPESARFVTGRRRALKLGMDETDFQNLKRVQDLESQRQRKAVSMEEAIIALAKFYLEAKDPILKAERATKKAERAIEDRQKTKVIVSENNSISLNKSVHAPEFQTQPGTSEVPRTSKPVVRQWETALETPPDFFMEPFFQPKRTLIPARELHQVRLRDQTRCTHLNEKNERCEQKRWLEIHHVKPLSHGGNHEASNLTTLCSAHHKQEHQDFTQDRTHQNLDGLTLKKTTLKFATKITDAILSV